MSAVVQPTKIFDYFSNLVDLGKAQQLHSFCIARSFYHVATLIIGHSNNDQCHCFNAKSVDC